MVGGTHLLKANFGAEVESYLRARKPYPQELIDFVAEKIGGKTVDLGCGPGRSAYRLADKVTTLIALDGDKGMIQAAIEGSRHKNITFVHSDVKDLPPDTYDHATAFEAFSWFSEHVQTIYNSIHPGGTFVVVDANGGGFQKDCRAFLTKFLGKEITRPSVADENETLRKAGFEITETRVFQSIDEFDWEDTQAKIKSHSFWSGLAPEDQNDKVWTALTTYVRENKMKDGKLTILQTHTVTVAKKIIHK